ncbi:unnamed protein product, partial [Ceratitis capitata]
MPRRDTTPRSTAPRHVNMLSDINDSCRLAGELLHSSGVEYLRLPALDYAGV